MANATSKVLTTVNAPYSANLSACELAACISDLDTMSKATGPTLSFFTEVKLAHQNEFISAMGVSKKGVQSVANHIASKCPFEIALAH